MIAEPPPELGIPYKRRKRHMERDSRLREKKNVFRGLFGGLVVIVGALLLLERLDIIEGDWGLYWPVILIALGATMVVNWWRKRD